MKHLSNKYYMYICTYKIITGVSNIFMQNKYIAIGTKYYVLLDSQLTMYLFNVFFKSIQVIFHVLIPISVWNWNEHSKLSIRFINTLQSKPTEWNEVSPQCSKSPQYVYMYRCVYSMIINKWFLQAKH